MGQLDVLSRADSWAARVRWGHDIINEIGRYDILSFRSALRRSLDDARRACVRQECPKEGYSAGCSVGIPSNVRAKDPPSREGR
jgi:hypothetical protein